MADVSEYFSRDYAQARTRFLQAAGAAGLTLSSYPLDIPGRHGEPLAVDVARQGRLDARSLLMLTCGTHGIEGLSGSGVQTSLLHDADWMRRVENGAVAILYVHALNPYGFSHIRRVTQENVDLNRNFQDFSQALPANPGYGELHPLLLPEHWPPTWGNKGALLGLIARRGLRPLQTAVSGGQYERPDGLFFGGTAPTWSHLTLRQLLRDQAGVARRLGWIDLHTGLGHTGACERGFMGDRAMVQEFSRANAWWGKPTPLVHAGSRASQSSKLTGLMWNAVVQECQTTEVTGMYMEFGTRPVLDVLNALRGDHWLHLHPEAPADLARQVKQAMLDAFFVDTPKWKQGMVDAVRSAMFQALVGLRS